MLDSIKWGIIAGIIILGIGIFSYIVKLAVDRNNLVHENQALSHTQQTQISITQAIAKTKNENMNLQNEIATRENHINQQQRDSQELTKLDFLKISDCIFKNFGTLKDDCEK